MAKITINMKGIKSPLHLSEITFNTDGSSPHINPRVRLYAGEDMATAVQIGSVQTSNTDDYSFIIQRNQFTILNDGPNIFYIVYDILRPTLTNNFACGDDLVFNLTGFGVERPSDPTAYTNTIYTEPIERQTEFTPIQFNNYEN